MKHFTQNLRWLLMSVLLFVGVGAWAETATFSTNDFSGQGTSSTGSAISATVNGVTFACDKGFGTTQIRCYKGSVITISSDNTITAISFTFSGSYTGGMNTSYTGLSTHSWTQTLESQARLTAINVTYTAAATNQVSTPSFSPNGGSFLNSQEVTITCSTDGASISYSTDDGSTWQNYSSALTLTETTTVKAKATKSGMDDSNVATATFTKATAMTVAEARAAIDAGTGTTGAYVSGIVSQIDEISTSYGNATYWISDDGTTTDQLEAYRGKYLNNTSFSSTDQLKVGDVVVIYGNLKLYNSIYEFDANNYIVSLERPAVAVEAPEFNVAEGAYTEAQTVSITCATSGATIYYTTDGTDPTTASTQYSTPITISSTTTLKAIAVAGSDQSTVTFATYTIYSTTDPGMSGATAFTVEQAITYISSLTGTSPMDVYVSGKVSQIDSYNSGVITYWISDDGTTTTQMEVYKGKGLNGENFTAQDNLTVGDQVIVCGKVKMYNTTPEFDSGSKLVSHTQNTDTRTELFLNEFYQDGTNTTIPAGSTITITVGETPEFTRAYPTLENGVGVRLTQGEIVYTGDNDALGTVDPVSGEITLASGATGTLKVTATFAGNDTYKGFTGFYFLVVNAAITPGNDLFNETFAGFKGSGGRDEQYSGSVGAGSTDSGTDETGWTFTSCGAASKCLKFGTGTSNGTFITRTITLTGDGTLTFSAAGWGDTKTNTLTVTVNDDNITLSGDTEVELTNGEWTDYTVDITGATGSFSLTFTGKRGFIDDIKVVKASTLPSPELAWSEATASATVGEAFTAPTLSNPNSVTVSYESTNDNVAIIDANGYVSIIGAGTTTIKAIFAGNDTYKAQTVSYILTVTAPAVVYTTIKELQDNATTTATDFQMQMTNIYVTAVKGNQAWISDGIYGALIYTSNHGLSKGQKLNGTLAAKLVLYNGATEITNFDASNLTITEEELAPVNDKSISALTVANQSMPITLTDLVYNAADKTFVDDEEVAIAFYDQFATGVSLIDGHTYEVTGLITYHNQLQLAPFTADDVIDQTLAPAVTAPTFDPAGGTYTTDQTVSITCATEGATIYYTLDETVPTTESVEYTEALTITETTTVKAIAVKDGATSAVSEATYTINKPEAPYAKCINSDFFVKVTNLSQLENGDAVILVNESADQAMSIYQTNNNRSAKPETIIPWSADEFYVANTKESTQKFTLVKDGDNYYFYANHGEAQGYLYAAGLNNNNYMRTEPVADDNAKAAIMLDNGDATITFQGGNTRNIMRFNVGSNLFSCYASTSSVKDPVQIYVEVERPTETKTVNLTEATGCYKTIVAPYDLDLSESSLEAYIVTLSGDKTEANLTEVSKVPAGTPVILHSASAGTYELTKAIAETDMDDVSANEMKVSKGDVEGDFDGSTSTIYVLNMVNSQIGFYPLNSGKTLAAGKCYIELEAASGVKFIGFTLDDATGINGITSDKMIEGTVYNLAGQRVNNPTKGIYIVNGKKVYVK